MVGGGVLCAVVNDPNTHKRVIRVQKKIMHRLQTNSSGEIFVRSKSPERKYTKCCRCFRTQANVF